jgi:hypothetical protein
VQLARPPLWLDRLADLRRVVERPIAAPRPDGVDAYNR